MTQNMYRVGDYVYFEVFPSSPYQIRRIEELNKTPSGTVEAKVMCFYRRRDLPVSLLKIADQAERQSQILSRPRRSLLTRATLASTSSSNGDGSSDDAKAELKENGIASATAEDLSQSASKPTGDGKQETDPPVSTTTTDAVVKAEDEPVDKKPDATAVAAATVTAAAKKNERSFGYAGLPLGADELNSEQIHALRQRELFLSRQIETLPATQIRGKCTVVILNEVETCDMYMEREDAFFYSLVYDPANQTLLADKGKIEIGERNQAKIPDYIPPPAATPAKSDEVDSNKENGELMMVDEEEGDQAAGARDVLQAKNPVTATTTESGGIQVTERESVVYHPHHTLTDRDIDQFLIIARAVGTFSRALDSSSTMKLPSLHMTASAASRDVTLLHAMALLHQAKYDIGQATKYLVPPPSKQHYPLEADKVTCHNTVSLGGPILCRDQLEEWSASEATLFEDAIEKYGKDFHDIRVDCLPWKSIRDIVEYYYMWKTTARYTDMQKSKAAEQENKLKQVYIPTFNKPNPNLVGPPNHTGELMKGQSACESCKKEESTQWYAWGPAHLQLRLCNDCWVVIWKKRGGLRCPHEYEVYDLDGATDMGAAHLMGSGQGANRPFNPASNRGGNTTGYYNQQQQTNRGSGIPRNGNNPQMPGSNKSIPQQHHQHHQTNMVGVGGVGGNPVVVGPKGRMTFFLSTNLQARIARRMAPRSILNMRKAARSPFKGIDAKTIQAFYYTRPLQEVLRVARQVKGGQMSAYALEYLNKLHAKHGLTAGNGAAMIAAVNMVSGGVGGAGIRR